MSARPSEAALQPGLERDVLAAAAGDSLAYARLVERHSGLVSSIALATVRDVAASEDVAQEVFLLAWADLHKLRSPSSFLPWLRQLTRNRAVESLRQGRPGARVANPDALLEAVADPAPAADDRLADHELRTTVFECIEQLPDDAREVVTLYYREGRSAAQVAELLGMREEAVKKRLSRARQKLRDALEKTFGDALEKTAPRSAFTAAVIAGLPQVGAVTTAAKGLGAAKLVGAAGKAAGLTALGGVALGMVSGVGGVLTGYRAELKRTQDPGERRALHRYAVIQSAATVLAAASLPMAALWVGLWAAWALLFAFIAFTGYMIFGYVWKAGAERRAAERAVDPTAAARHRRRLWFKCAGFTVGAGMGLMGMWLGSHGFRFPF